ncbi:MAG TPA: hypothetical protein DIC56_10020 [Rhizobium sp.]|nr:hypothetical protein [Rhizobium sp.]
MSRMFSTIKWKRVRNAILVSRIRMKIAVSMSRRSIRFDISLCPIGRRAADNRQTPGRAWALIIMALFAAGIAGPALAADTEGAIAAVKRIHANTVEASKASAGRKVAQLSALLDKYLDLNEIASRVLGKAWDGASAGERQDFKRVLRDVMAVELSRKIRPDDRFAISGAKAINDRDVVVFSHQIRQDGSDRRLDWKMRPCRTSFCIFDLVGNGASLSVARRDEYAARLRALGGSLAALTRSIRAEIDARP